MEETSRTLAPDHVTSPRGYEWYFSRPTPLGLCLQLLDDDPKFVPLAKLDGYAEVGVAARAWHREQMGGECCSECGKVKA